MWSFSTATCEIFKDVTKIATSFQPISEQACDNFCERLVLNNSKYFCIVEAILINYLLLVLHVYSLCKKMAE